MEPHDTSNTAGWAERTVLKDGNPMPLLGIGTQYGWSEDGQNRGQIERTAQYVALGLRTGFRLIDTARCYGTEVGVLQGLEASGVARSAAFVISKAWPGVDHTPGLVSSRAAIAESAARLGGYVDLYLVHHPVPGWQDLWRALEEARDQGLVRSIGVSNFLPEHLDELARIGRHAPVANEVHLHPFIASDRAATLRRCAADHVVVIAFPRSPWRDGQGTAVDEVAREVSRTRAQVMLRWAIEHGHAIVPLSTDEQHLRENLAVHEFRLTPVQVNALDHVRVATKVNHAIDVLNAELVEGWAFAPAGLAAIHVLVDGKAVGTASHGRSRPDVQKAYDGAAGSLDCGFSFRFPDGLFTRAACDVALSFELASGARVASRSTTVRHEHNERPR